MRLEIFAPEHLDTFVPSEIGLKILDDLDINEAQKSWDGNAVAAVEDGITYGLAGVSDEGNKVGQAWLILSDEILNHPMFLFRMTKRCLNEIEKKLDFKMIEVWVQPGFKDGKKMALRLGFKEAGEHRFARMIR